MKKQKKDSAGRSGLFVLENYVRQLPFTKVPSWHITEENTTTIRYKVNDGCARLPSGRQ